MVEAVSIARENKDLKPVFWIPFIEHTRNQESADSLKAAGVPLLPTGRYGCSVLKKILDFAVSTFDAIEPAIPERKHGKSHGLSEYESLNYLKDHGVPVPDQAVASTIDEAAAAAGKLGYPLSVKIHSADIQHKSDVGGVKLNIKDEAGLREAFVAVMENCRKNAPGAALEGVLLKPMLKAGVEMIIGVNNDRDFGPMIMVGMGGVFVELFKDVQLAPAPLTQKQAEAMIGKLASYPLLNGYRGGPVCDKKALANLLVKISQMAAAGKDTIKELDINPVFVTEKGAEIADALLVLYDS
jgi:acetyltransferase